MAKIRLLNSHMSSWRSYLELWLMVEKGGREQALSWSGRRVGGQGNLPPGEGLEIETLGCLWAEAVGMGVVGLLGK